MSESKRITRHPNLIGLALCGLLAAGCETTKPASASFASVTIHDRTPEQIQRAAAEVFQGDEYRVISLDPEAMLFEKEGSKMQSLSYNGLVGAQEGARIAVRVKAMLVDLGAGAYRLQCQAYMVKNAGESIFEEETRLSGMRSGPYQSLLDKVAKQLKKS